MKSLYLVLDMQNDLVHANSIGSLGRYCKVETSQTVQFG